MRLPSAARAACSALVLTVVAGLAGCAQDSRPAGRRAAPPIIPLAGRATLLDGTLLAEVRFGPMHFENEGEGDRRFPGRLHGSAGVSGHNGDVRPSGNLGFSLGGGGGGGGMGGGMRGGGGGRGGGERQGPPPDGSERRGGGGGRAMGAAGPLASIDLRFTNLSAQPLTFRVAEFRSVLGNFVVHPEVFELAPGASASATPMATQLGAELEAVDLQLTVRTASGPHPVRLELRPVPRPVPGGDAAANPPAR